MSFGRPATKLVECTRRHHRPKHSLCCRAAGHHSCSESCWGGLWSMQVMYRPVIASCAVRSLQLTASTYVSSRRNNNETMTVNWTAFLFVHLEMWNFDLLSLSVLYSVYDMSEWYESTSTWIVVQPGKVQTLLGVHVLHYSKNLDHLRSSFLERSMHCSNDSDN